LRQAAKFKVPADDVRRQVDDAREAASVGKVNDHEYKRLQATVAAFEEASGVELGTYDFQSRHLGEELKLVRKMKIPGLFSNARNLLDALEKVTPTLREAMDGYEEALPAIPRGD
jgi:hypothetical protein